MVFGAWCDRQYGFVYDEIRARGGLAWFPTLEEDGDVTWKPNRGYSTSSLLRKSARPYPELGISGTIPIYDQFAHNPDSVQWVSEPARVARVWQFFEC
jgi:glucose-6-phosphate isomerase